MTAIETLDGVYGILVDKAHSGTVTLMERSLLLHAAEDVAYRKSALELIEETRERREAIRFGPAGAVLAR